MSKRQTELANETTVSQLAVKIRDSANQVWLAGLGAFSKAQQEGAGMFETLVAEGEKVQERTKTAADERVTEMKEKATETWDKTWDKLEKVFEDPMGRALRALNVPTRKDIAVLSKRVHELTATTKKLAEEEGTHGHGRAHRAKAA